MLLLRILAPLLSKCFLRIQKAPFRVFLLLINRYRADQNSYDDRSCPPVATLVNLLAYDVHLRRNWRWFDSFISWLYGLIYPRALLILVDMCSIFAKIGWPFSKHEVSSICQSTMRPNSTSLFCSAPRVPRDSIQKATCYYLRTTPYLKVLLFKATWRKEVKCQGQQSGPPPHMFE
jgi:hypothetical protein